jgi:hypothetical protein
VLSAIEILIERTKTNPEEFANGYTGDYGKWDDVIKEFNLCMTTEEREALEAALTNARREMFNEAVMKRLAGSDKKNDLLEEIAIRSNKPKSILTMSQITADSLKILEQQLTMKGIKYATEYDVATDSYTLAQQRKK